MPLMRLPFYGSTVIALVVAALTATGANSVTRSVEKDVTDSLLKQVKSTYDGSLQPCYFWAPEKARDEAVPQIVGLHTWSGDWRQRDHYVPALNYAKKRGWAMVGPRRDGEL